MKYYIPAICLVLVVLALMAAPAQDNRQVPWGTALTEFRKAHPAGPGVVEFTPRDNPDYKNKIMSYITAIDDKFISDIVIIRLNGVPVKDYLFVKGTLCTVLEDWDVIEESRQNAIMNSLKGAYGEPSVQKEENFYINSFKSQGTNVLYYLLKQPDGRAKCKVYYYTSTLFRMLLMDN